MPSVKPALRAALVSQLSTALAPIEVRYGAGFTDSQVPGALMIGVSDPFDEDDTEIDSSTQAWAHTGLNAKRDEIGDIRCAVLYWTGDMGSSGSQEAYEGVYATSAAVETYLRANPTVGGVSGLAWAEYGTEETTREGERNGLACVVLQFTVHFRARI